MNRRQPVGAMAKRYPQLSDMLDHVLVHSSDQNPKEVAEAIGVALPTLYSYTEGTRRMPGDLIVPLVRATQDLRVVHWIAEQVECVCYPIPATMKRENTEVMAGLCMAQLEHCQAVEGVVKALEDGGITRNELPGILTEIDDALRALLTLRALVKEEAK